MRVRTILGPVLALAAAGLVSAQALYAPPEGDFTVAFPAEPSVRVTPAKRSHDITFRRYVDQEASRAFVVAIDEYPDGALPPSADAGVYDHILRDRAGDDPTRLKSTRAARLSGKPCLEGTFNDPDGDIEVVRVLMIGDRLYQLTYVHPDGADQPEAGAAFFNSFRIKSGG